MREGGEGGEGEKMAGMTWFSRFAMGRMRRGVGMMEECRSVLLHAWCGGGWIEQSNMVMGQQSGCVGDGGSEGGERRGRAIDTSTCRRRVIPHNSQPVFSSVSNSMVRSSRLISVSAEQNPNKRVKEKSEMITYRLLRLVDEHGPMNAEQFWSIAKVRGRAQGTRLCL